MDTLYVIRNMDVDTRHKYCVKAGTASGNDNRGAVLRLFANNVTSLRLKHKSDDLITRSSGHGKKGKNIQVIDNQVKSY